MGDLFVFEYTSAVLWLLKPKGLIKTTTQKVDFENLMVSLLYYLVCRTKTQAQKRRENVDYSIHEPEETDPWPPTLDRNFSDVLNAFCKYL